jgi:cephalosporin hydroxylase
MPDTHIRELDKKITALSDALAHLGKGTSLIELLKIIRFPGYTTPAEFALTIAILDSMHAHTNALAKLETQLLGASKLVIQKGA